MNMPSASPPPSDSEPDGLFLDELRREVEQYRTFIANSAEGIWRFDITVPVSVDLSEDAQLDAFYADCYLAACNDALARMYGYEHAEDLLGARLTDMVPRTVPENEAYLRAFIRSGYRLRDVESIEQSRDGQEKRFANSIVGIVENDYLLCAWGTQRDITEQRRLEHVLREREQDYASLVNNTLDVLIRYDRDKRYRYINQAIVKHSGLTPEHFIGKRVGDVGAPPDVTAAWDKAINHVLQTGEPQFVEFSYVNPFDKILHTYETTLSPEFEVNAESREDEPRVVSVVALSRDVTERAQAERALRVSEERYRALVEVSSQIVWTTRPDGQMSGPQPAWCAYTGQTEADVQGYGWSQAVHPNDEAATLAVGLPAFRAGTAFTVEHRLRRFDGVWRVFVMRAVPLFHEDRTLREWVGVHTDVTEQREAEEKQRRFVREMLFSVTGGRLRLCETSADLPAPLSPATPEVPLTAPALRELRQQTEAVCAAFGFDAAQTGDLVTAAGEAAMNAVRHAGGGIGWICADETFRIVQVWVHDKGAGIQYDNLHRATLEAGYSSVGTLGQGFSLILVCADRVWLLTGPTGTTIVLEKERAASEVS